MPDDDTSRSRGPRPVAIVGAGSIGRAFAVVNATAGRRVLLYDPAKSVRETAAAAIARTLDDLDEFELLDEPRDAVLARVSVVAALEQAVADARFVHECAPEDIEVKRRVTADIDRLSPDDAVIASASSALPASRFAAGLPGRARCLVAHPGNPPFLLRVIELVPAPFTDPGRLTVAESFLIEAGLTPILVRKEVRGFVFNRLQGALLREAYCLVRDGVASVDDVDRVVRDGLGFRWSVVGPFEAVDLNTRGGIAKHAAVLGPAYEAMGAERGQHDPWTPDLVDRVVAERRKLMPLDHWLARVRWRDRELMRLLAARRRRDD